MKHKINSLAYDSFELFVNFDKPSEIFRLLLGTWSNAQCCNQRSKKDLRPSKDVKTRRIFAFYGGCLGSIAEKEKKEEKKTFAEGSTLKFPSLELKALHWISDDFLNFDYCIA